MVDIYNIHLFLVTNLNFRQKNKDIKIKEMANLLKNVQGKKKDFLPNDFHTNSHITFNDGWNTWLYSFFGICLVSLPEVDINDERTTLALQNFYLRRQIHCSILLIDGKVDVLVDLVFKIKVFWWVNVYMVHTLVEVFIKNFLQIFIANFF